jgi:DNA polymerase
MVASLTVESGAWNEAVGDTLRYLHERKAAGEEFVQVDESVLRQCKKPAPRAASTAARVAPPPSFAFEQQAPRLVSGDKKAAYAELEAQIKACTQCAHLVSFRKNVVPGVGNLDAAIMFVGEAPGADEDAQGEPFVGRAGQLLTKIIQTMALRRQDVFIGNILKCRPNVDTPAGNRKPTAPEMETCIPWLWRQIDIVGPRVLVALGDTAVKGLIPDMKAGITKVRGQWLQFRGIPLMPTYHPAYLLRNQSLALKRQCWEDMLAIMERAGLPISDKQQRYFLAAS